MSGVAAIPLVVAKGDKIVLYGWRHFNALNIVALTASFAAPVAAYFFVGWWLSLPALAWLGYALWAVYRSVLTEITVQGSEVLVDGKAFHVRDVGSFDVRQFDDGSGMDDLPGRTEVWMTLRGDPIQIALMSRQTDGDAIAALLNSKLEAARTRA